MYVYMNIAVRKYLIFCFGKFLNICVYVKFWKLERENLSLKGVNAIITNINFLIPRHCNLHVVCCLWKLQTMNYVVSKVWNIKVFRYQVTRYRDENKGFVHCTTSSNSNNIIKGLHSILDQPIFHIFTRVENQPSRQR